MTKVTFVRFRYPHTCEDELRCDHRAAQVLSSAFLFLHRTNCGPRPVAAVVQVVEVLPTFLPGERHLDELVAKPELQACAQMEIVQEHDLRHINQS